MGELQNKEAKDLTSGLSAALLTDREAWRYFISYASVSLSKIKEMVPIGLLVVWPKEKKNLKTGIRPYS